MTTSKEFEAWESVRNLTSKLNGLTAAGDPHADAAQLVLRDADVIISHAEVSERHGVGKFLQMMFLGEPNIISIRSANLYDGRNELGDVSLCISHIAKSRDAVCRRVLSYMGEHTVRRVLCAPYFPDDVRTAIAIKDIYDAPLCTYIMDDQNVYANGIPDDLMRELLERSELVLGISREMCAVYERKYNRKVWPMPPLAPGRLIPSRLNVPQTKPEMHGVIIGNIWGQRWLEQLRNTVRGSGIKLTWYCNGEFRWLPCGKDSLLEDSIIPLNPLEENELIRVLRQHWFAVLPSGMLDDKDDDRRFIAQLSLPSRVPYMMATSHVPILVLGSPDAASARFVKQFGIGTVAPYERGAFTEAVRYIMEPDVNLAMRKHALAAASRFTDVGAGEWIWQSLALGEPIDSRFEGLFPKRTK